MTTTTSYRAIIRTETGTHYTEVTPLSELTHAVTRLGRRLYEENALSKADHTSQINELKKAIYEIKERDAFIADTQAEEAAFKADSEALSDKEKARIRRANKKDPNYIKPVRVQLTDEEKLSMLV